MNSIGPVSDALEADLRPWVRRHGVAVWFDLDDHYSASVDRLATAVCQESGRTLSEANELVRKDSFIAPAVIP